jgi:hypothetical protein
MALFVIVDTEQKQVVQFYYTIIAIVKNTMPTCIPLEPWIVFVALSRCLVAQIEQSD